MRIVKRPYLRKRRLILGERKNHIKNEEINIGTKKGGLLPVAIALAPFVVPLVGKLVKMEVKLDV